MPFFNSISNQLSKKATSPTGMSSRASLSGDQFQIVANTTAIVIATPQVGPQPTWSLIAFVHARLLGSKSLRELTLPSARTGLWTESESKSHSLGGNLRQKNINLRK